MNKKNDNKNEFPLRMARRRQMIPDEFRKVAPCSAADKVHRNPDILAESGMMRKPEQGGPAINERGQKESRGGRRASRVFWG